MEDFVEKKKAEMRRSRRKENLLALALISRIASYFYCLL